MVKYIYTLGAAGERLKVEELDRTVEYTYDDLYRLTSETITEGEKVTTYTYAYDNVSNRILKTENGKETAYVYNSLNQLVSDSDNSYEYDINGNLVRVIGSAHSALYEYNCDNKLVKATVQQGNNVIEESYTYDYAGNRTSKTTRTNGHVEFVKFLNDNSSLTNVLAEIGSDGTEKCVYTIGADLISQERDGKVSVYLYDGHGSVVGLATMGGKVTDTYTYDAFGNLIDSTGSTKNCYRYCGEQFNETTGLYYLRARYMDTTTGRFISQDSYNGNTYDPISLHKYLYANANPAMNTDPSGYITSKAEATISMGIQSVLDSIIIPSYVNLYKDLVTLLVASVVLIVTKPLSDYLVGFLIDVARGDVDSANISDSARSKTVGEIGICYKSLGRLGNLMVTVASELKKHWDTEPPHNHHIVPRKHHYCKISQCILKLCGIGIDSEKNLVRIKAKTHRAIHSMECQWFYCQYVNSRILTAYSIGIDEEHSTKYVSDALDMLRSEIRAVDSMIL